MRTKFRAMLIPAWSYSLMIESGGTVKGSKIRPHIHKVKLYDTLKPYMKNTMLVIKNLFLSFGSNKVLRGVDLKLEEGESLVVLGPSGCGKSVLLKCILGLIPPSKGEIFIDSTNLLKASPKQQEELRSQIGMLFQGGALFDSLTVLENVAFGPLQRGMERKAADALALEMLDHVGLQPEIGGLSPAELSGGMQKRVALARAIAIKPKILFFDEPTTGLDPIRRTMINQLIVRSTRSLNASAITITHDLESVQAIADQVAFLYGGKILWTGPVSKLYKSGCPELEAFVHGRPPKGEGL